jgi:hypothetical protein
MMGMALSCKDALNTSVGRLHHANSDCANGVANWLRQGARGTRWIGMDGAKDRPRVSRPAPPNGPEKGVPLRGVTCPPLRPAIKLGHQSSWPPQTNHETT